MPPATAANSPAEGAAALGSQRIVDSRSEPRIRVSWPGRVQMPDGRVVDLKVRDISDNGLGILVPASIPPMRALTFAMGVPHFDDPQRFRPVTGQVKAAYVVLQGDQFAAGLSWVLLADDSRDLIKRWVRKLR